MNTARPRWQAFLLELNPDRPADQNLYVSHSRSPAGRITTDLLNAHSTHPKVLLVGARGGGKSSELRAISRQLDSFHRVEIDLDRSGVSAASVSAFDLLYMSGLGLLRHVPESEREPLFAMLSKAYARNDDEQQKKLGGFRTALAGLSDFASIVAKTTAAAGDLSTAAGAAAVGAAATGLRLLVGANASNPESAVVAETSPSGRALQDACNAIAQRVRRADPRPICVLLDGLEKMNGEAGERFRQVFEQTRLLADAPWSSVIAAPPCTLTQTNSVDGRGYTTTPIWGFDPDDPSQLRALLERRLLDAQMDPARDVNGALLDRIVRDSGGLPRHAVMIARNATLNLLAGEGDVLTEAHVVGGAATLGEALGRALANDEYLTALQRVASSGRLPRDGVAATLFADGRILAHPPTAGSRLPTFAVHPLLLDDVMQYKPDA